MSRGSRQRQFQRIISATSSGEGSLRSDLNGATVLLIHYPIEILAAGVPILHAAAFPVPAQLLEVEVGDDHDHLKTPDRKATLPARRHGLVIAPYPANLLFAIESNRYR